MKNKIGIVGGGQLGKMLTLEAKRLGFTVVILDPTRKSPAAQVSDYQLVADFKNEKAIKRLAELTDYITFEIELANADILNEISKLGAKVNPSAKTLNIIKDRLKQKEFLVKNNIPVAPFRNVNNRENILESAKKLGYPILLKARLDAYDGRGNVLIKDEKEIDDALEKLVDRELFLEGFVSFKKELAVMIARSSKGEIAVYPVVETVHKNSICHTVFAPAPVDTAIQKKAKNLAIKVIKVLKGAGVFGIEMFLTKDNKVLVNEIAPRVHNSGHYSIEACLTSQFEQHIRAITGLPLGRTDMVVSAAVMINILGERHGQSELKGLEKALKLPNVSVHIYGKTETRIERKMGHITAIDSSLKKAYNKALIARKLISI
ncbi:5-(carboxyamino)imidazole ribonucleotide synthase [Candidatus Daviesbacteria bacterium]|nr:5-(carboxyamino)imidazole ribonucleotide synthase [Candidatus Daviesbacteria bacterium]